MSIKFIIAATIIVGAASLSVSQSATAQSACNGSVRHFARGSVQCYYLPTVSNGRVTGLQEHLNIHFNRSGGAAIGAAPGTSSIPCRYLPTVVGGRVIGSHQVCG